jgi:hypothetical protein
VSGTPPHVNAAPAPQDVLHVVGASGEPRIITFGGAGRGCAADLQRLASTFRAAASRSRSPSPAAGSPRVAGSPRSRSPTRFLEDLDSNGRREAPPVVLPEDLEERLAQCTLAVRGGGEVEVVCSVCVSRARCNAVAVAVTALPPDVVRGLAEDKSMPFLFFRLLSSCFIEARADDQTGAILALKHALKQACARAAAH